jgi:predicted nucleic acid-binding protein
VTGLRWLIDKSALGRVGLPSVADVLHDRMSRGLVGISIATELEVGFSAQSVDGYHQMRTRLIQALVPVALPARAEDRAREVQSALVERAQHRAVSVPDLLIASTAEIEGLTVLHYDADFDLIAAITGQSMEWVVPRGSIA